MSILTGLLSGCASIRHELQPHRLNRMNRVPAPSFDPEFTRSERPPKGRLVRLEGGDRQASLTANRADIILARGQDPKN